MRTVISALDGLGRKTLCQAVSLSDTADSYDVSRAAKSVLTAGVYAGTLDLVTTVAVELLVGRRLYSVAVPRVGPEPLLVEVATPAGRSFASVYCPGGRPVLDSPLPTLRLLADLIRYSLDALAETPCGSIDLRAWSRAASGDAFTLTWTGIATSDMPSEVAHID